MLGHLDPSAALRRRWPRLALDQPASFKFAAQALNADDVRLPWVVSRQSVAIHAGREHAHEPKDDVQPNLAATGSAGGALLTASSSAGRAVALSRFNTAAAILVVLASFLFPPGLTFWSMHSMSMPISRSTETATATS